MVTSHTDWSRDVLVGTAGDLELPQADHREANEVGHLELMDKISVAAGVTAKDKRSKNKANMVYHSRLAKKGVYCALRCRFKDKLNSIFVK